jgi:hypothetical protein
MIPGVKKAVPTGLATDEVDARRRVGAEHDQQAAGEQGEQGSCQPDPERGAQTGSGCQRTLIALEPGNKAWMIMAITTSLTRTEPFCEAQNAHNPGEAQYEQHRRKDKTAPPARRPAQPARR